MSSLFRHSKAHLTAAAHSRELAFNPLQEEHGDRERLEQHRPRPRCLAQPRAGAWVGIWNWCDVFCDRSRKAARTRRGKWTAASDKTSFGALHKKRLILALICVYGDYREEQIFIGKWKASDVCTALWVEKLNFCDFQPLFLLKLWSCNANDGTTTHL